MNDKYIKFLKERIRLANSKESLAAYKICLKQYYRIHNVSWCKIKTKHHVK